MELAWTVHGHINSRILVDRLEGARDLLGPGRDATNMPVIEDPDRILVLGMMGRARLLMF